MNRIKTASVAMLLASFIGLAPAAVQTRDQDRRDRQEDRWDRREDRRDRRDDRNNEGGLPKAEHVLPADAVGLYVAEVELEAPASEGLHTWSVKRLQSDLGIPHAESSIDFGVRVVGRPEHLVTIEIVDALARTPLNGAQVVMNPYRVVADEHGVARVRVTRGTYTVFVSQTNYPTFGLPSTWGRTSRREWSST